MTEEEKRERQKEINRKAVKKYTDKIKPIGFTVSYKTTDKPDGERLKEYLAQTGQTANAYIKSLIRADLDAKNIPYPGGNCQNNDKIDAEYLKNNVLPWVWEDEIEPIVRKEGLQAAIEYAIENRCLE